jgi:hypothetical protein
MASERNAPIVVKPYARMKVRGRVGYARLRYIGRLRAFRFSVLDERVGHT